MAQSRFIERNELFERRMGIREGLKIDDEFSRIVAPAKNSIPSLTCSETDFKRLAVLGRNESLLQ